MKSNTSIPSSAPLTKAQALKKYEKATRLRWRSPLAEWRDAFPTVESLLRFREETGHLSWPENWGQSPMDDAFSLAWNLANGISESSRRYMLENAETVTGKQVLAVYAEYGLKVEMDAHSPSAPLVPVASVGVPVTVLGGEATTESIAIKRAFTHDESQSIVAAAKWLERIHDRMKELPENFHKGLDPLPVAKELRGMLHSVPSTIQPEESVDLVMELSVARSRLAESVEGNEILRDRIQNQEEQQTLSHAAKDAKIKALEAALREFMRAALKHGHDVDRLHAAKISADDALALPTA